MSDKDYLIALSTFESFGPTRINLLLKYFESAKNIWLSDQKELITIGLNENLVSRFIDHRNKFNFPKYFDLLRKHSVRALTKEDINYPESLKEIPDAPNVLYVRGELKKIDSRGVAIVGTRSMTSYGKEIAQSFAGTLGSMGITVISGLALGIDAEAQRAALKSGGRTISVLASGLDIISPLANRALALEFIKNSGALISEYPIGHAPRTFDFPVRDRLISALSKAVIVIEGKIKSGTFYTVQAASEQGRPVFAVPGPITSLTSAMPNYLIQNGAKLVTNVKEVLDEVNLEFKVDPELSEKIMPFNPVEQKIADIISHEPLHLDEVARISGIPIAEVSARLTIMEMKGMVKNMGNGVYRRI